MKRSLRAFQWPVVGLGLLVAGALGASASLAVLPQRAPEALASAKPLADVPVAQRTFDDSRTVEVSLETGGERQASSPRSGTLTSMPCRSGGTLASGTAAAAIDGQKVVALATSEPLWRDLSKDDTGGDVRALQSELARLGHPVRADGVVGRETLAAAAALLGVTPRAGKPPLHSIPFTAFAWIPSPTVTTMSCPALLGGTIETGEPLATLPVALTGARIATTPERLIDGARTLTVGEVRATVSDDLTVSDPAALTALAAGPDYAAATATDSDGEPTVTGSLALNKPLTVEVVPPSSVYGLQGSAGCVASGGEARTVTVVGSELGETFVTRPAGQKLGRVSLTSRRPPCR